MLFCLCGFFQAELILNGWRQYVSDLDIWVNRKPTGFGGRITISSEITGHTMASTSMKIASKSVGYIVNGIVSSLGWRENQGLTPSLEFGAGLLETDDPWRARLQCTWRLHGTVHVSPVHYSTCKCESICEIKVWQQQHLAMPELSCLLFTLHYIVWKWGSSCEEAIIKRQVVCSVISKHGGSSLQPPWSVDKKLETIPKYVKNMNLLFIRHIALKRGGYINIANFAMCRVNLA